MLWVDASMAQDQTDTSTDQQADDNNADVDMVIRGTTDGGLVLYGEPVKRFFAPEIRGWNVLDNQRLILYATRSRPYLITLRRQAFGLNHSTVIGIRRNSSTIDARFDNIIVDDFPYAIERIEKLTPEVAKRLRGIEPKPEELAPEEDPESG